MRERWERILRYFTWVGSIFLLALIFLVVVDVSLRKQGVAFIGGIELVEFFMVVTVFLALAYVQHEKRHIRMVVIIERIRSLKVRSILEILTCFFGLFIYAFIFWYVLKWSIEDFRTGEFINEAAPKLTYVAPWRALVPFGCLFYSAQLIIDIIDNLRRLRGNSGT